MFRVKANNLYLLIFILPIYLGCLYYNSVAQEKYVHPEDAHNYIGESKTVCGVVASSKYAVNSKGSPTFLNLNKPYPNHIFTVVIWGSDRYKFKNSPEIFYRGKDICVTGLITTYRAKPQIEVDKPPQIEIQTN